MRKVAEIKQEDLADQVHLSRASIVNIEKGRHRAQLHVLYDLASALKCQVSDLLPHVEELQSHLTQDMSKQLHHDDEKDAVAHLITLAKKGEKR